MNFKKTLINNQEKEVVKMYSEENKTYRQITKIFRISNERLQDILKKYNVEIRRYGSWNKGKKISEEMREKLRIANTGENSPHFGKKLTEEHKRKIGEKSKKWHEEIGFSEETKEKIRTTRLKKINSGEINYKKQQTRIIGNKIPERKDLVFNTDKIISLYCSGLSARKIATIFDTTKSTIVNLLRKNNIEIRETSFYMSGEKHPFFNNWSSFLPYPETFNKQFKEAIKIRDAFLCLKCGMREEDSLILFKRKLVIHHIDYIKENTFEENCCALCPRCNTEVNVNRKHWTKFFQSLLSERYGYKYSEDGNVILELEKLEIKQ